jgi:SAM-dependent methyltransferase
MDKVMTDAEIREAIAPYKFYHVIPLTETLSTPGDPAHTPAQDLFMKHLKTLDLKGKRVLDIGCRDGLFSFAAESMGAAEVIGIDNDLSKGATEFLIPFFKSKVRMLQQNLYDLKAQGIGVLRCHPFSRRAVSSALSLLGPQGPAGHDETRRRASNRNGHMAGR